MGNALYIESDNGGRGVMLHADGKWYFCDCAFDGCYVYTDILEGTEQEAAVRVRTAIESGEIMNENDTAEYHEAFDYIPGYDGMTAEQIMEKEQETFLVKI